jgi:membrane-anchored protein YejM (alkaline phosphatase superfamily)
MTSNRSPVDFHALGGWLKARTESHTYVVTAFVLNLPFLFIVLWRHLNDVPLTGLTGVYVGAVFLGYYALIVFVLSTITFFILSFSRRLAIIASGAMLTATLFYFVVNSVVHDVYRFHVDAFWLAYAATHFQGFGIPPTVVFTAIVILIVIVVLEVGLFWAARRVKRQRLLPVAFVLTALMALTLSQSIHIAAYYNNDGRITSITPQLPFYYPVTSSKHAKKYGHLLPLLVPSDASARNAGASIRYPLRDFECSMPTGKQATNILMIVLESWRYDTMDQVVSPNMHALSKRSIVFQNHFSSGNSTPHGIFGLFYGIHPTYWEAVKGHSTAIDNPVMIDALEANGYAFGIYADSNFDRHKIKETVFAGIEVHESFIGQKHDTRDEDLTRQLIGFIEEQVRTERPFMGFAFYKSTHYSYHYPEESAHFRPARNLNVALLGNDADPTPYLNDYRNSVRHVDRLVGNIVDRLETLDILGETIVIVTSDHGEEFDDNGENYWGHTSNFSKFQTQVPMFMFLPEEEPRNVASVTSHTDLPVTILQEALGCGEDVQSYSNGRNLLGPQSEPRPIVLGGYVSHAFVLDDNVYAVYPMHVRSYKLSDVKADAATPRADLMKQAIEETSRFYRGVKDGGG